MNHKQLVQQMNEMKAELEALRNQVEAYENVETEIVKSPNAPTSRRRMLKRLALGAGAFAAATAAGAMSTGQQVLAETASANAIDAQGGDGGYGITVSTTNAGLAQLRLAPSTNSGAPTDATGRNVGELYVDSNGDLYYLAQVTPSLVWRQLAGTSTAGSMHALSVPVGLVATSAGTPINPNPSGNPKLPGYGTFTQASVAANKRSFQATGANGVPAGATALFAFVQTFSGPTTPPNARVTLWNDSANAPTNADGSIVVSHTHVVTSSVNSITTIIPLSASGTFAATTSASLHLVVSALGYYM
ncbi:MAG TPA: hypothetical protein VH186_08025 [Chloroflexia bacterium]|nr:hypothetical protein [Chloroflexia bacterium]